MGIIAALIGVGLLAYDRYIRTLNETMVLIAYGLVILGVFFYLLMDRE